jgi:hypothetical protein
MDLEHKRRLRTAIMKWAYEVTGGNESTGGDATRFTLPGDWAGQLPTKDDVDAAFAYLHGEGLLDVRLSGESMPLTFELTHAGVLEIEQALDAPTQRTEHFAPIISITQVQGDVYGGMQVQQGSANASQTGKFSTTEVRENAERFIAEARGVAAEASPDVQARTDADLARMEGELADLEPSEDILASIAKKVRGYLGLATAAAAVLNQLGWP